MEVDGLGSYQCQTTGLNLLFGKYGYRVYPQRIKEYMEVDISQAEVPPSEN